MASKEKKVKVLDRCRKIKDATHNSIDSLFDIYDDLKIKRGPATDQQQDLLRAIIVLGCAGLDSFMKQIVEDGLELVRKNNKKSHKYFIGKTQEILSGNTTDSIDLKIMSEILMSGKSDDMLSQKIVSLLTDHSLQNYGELIEILKAFGLPEELFKEEKDLIRSLFRSRNNIAHEFDFNFSRTGAGIKQREQQTREKTFLYTELIEKIIKVLEHEINNIIISIK